MAITPLPSAPAVTDSTAEFNTKAFAFVDALDTFVTETNAVAAEVDQDAADVAAAALDAAAIETIWDDMQPIFLGGKTSDPALDNEGNALVAGAIYFNTSTDTLRAYTGTDWADAGTAIPVTLTLDTFSGTGAETDFTLAVTPANANSVRVAISGVLQVPTTDYTVSGTTLSFITAPPSGTDNVVCLTTTPVAVGVPGDDTVSTVKLQDGSVTTDKHADDSVTFAKMQNIATARLLGRSTSGSGNVEELALGASLTLAAGTLSGTAASATQAGVVELATDGEVRSGVDSGRVMSVAGFRDNALVESLVQLTTSGSQFVFGSIPAWAKRITVMLSGVSLSGTDAIVMKLGDSGGLESSGYLGACALVNVATSDHSSYFYLTTTGAAAATVHGVCTLARVDESDNTWAMTSCFSRAGFVNAGSGSKSLSGALTQFSVETNGANTFDAGKISFIYE